MTGGIIDKLGNLYEAKGAILGLFRVIEGEALSIRYESIVPQDHGVDWFLRYPDHEESVQAKRSTTAGNWKISALGREGVLKSAGEWLGTGGNHVFTFVSASPAPDMNGLCESAGHAIDSGSLLSALSRPQRNNFEHLRGVWGVSPDTALDFLKRSRFAAQAESLLDELIRLHGEISFRDSANSVFPILRAYIEEHMGLELSAESIVRELERGARLSFRPHLGPALWERLRDANRIFSESYPIFGACTPIHRLEADSITDALSDVEGPRLILLTGSAGSG